MKKVKWFFLVNGFWMAVFTAAPAQDVLTARQIQERSLAATRVEGMESISLLVIVSPRGERRVRKMTMLSKLYNQGTLEKKMVRFVEPADVKGTGFLVFDHDERDDEKWIFLPALRKTRRIISAENAKSFMGSEFSYADMSLPAIDDFHYRLLSDERANGEPCYRLEIVPKDRKAEEENGFSKKISSISKNDFVLRRAVYFGRAGNEEKILEVKSVIEVDKQQHKFKPLEIEITNGLNKRKSVSTLLQVRFNPDIADEIFSTRFLEK